MARNAGDHGKTPPTRSAVILSLGFQLLVSAMGGFLLGSFIDKARRTYWAAPAGLLVGLFAGFHRVYLLAKSVVGRQR